MSWKIEKNEYGMDARIIDDRGRRICDIQWDMVCAVEGLRLSFDEGKKNAALIAAAPEMLEALRWACQRYECYHNPDVRGNCSTCAIGKAIAKAEGSEL